VTGEFPALATLQLVITGSELVGLRGILDMLHMIPTVYCPFSPQDSPTNIRNGSTMFSVSYELD